MLNHPRHLLRRHASGGDDEVALVLAALVVHDDEELAAGERSERVLDGVERERRARRGGLLAGKVGVAVRRGCDERRGCHG